MLATVAALHLLAAQVSAPPPAPADTPPPAEVPEEPRPQPPATGGDQPGAAPRDAPPAAAPRAGAPASQPRQQSLLSAESLQGGSAALAWAGWPEIGLMYAIGFSDRDDAGVFLSHDWAKSELRFGVLYRRPLSKAGPFDVGGRLGVAGYANFGAGYVYEENHSDRGLEVNPGVVLSRSGSGGVFSGLAEAPMTITWKYKSGFLFAPRVSLAFETPLWEGFTAGARVGFGYRAGSGGAPLKDGMGELQFLLLAGYQLL